MSVVQFVLGIALLVVGGACVLGRSRIVARHRGWYEARHVQPPMAYLVMGAILVLAGLSQVVLAVS